MVQKNEGYESWRCDKKLKGIFEGVLIEYSSASQMKIREGGLKMEQVRDGEAESDAGKLVLFGDLKAVRLEDIGNLEVDEC